MNTQTFSQDVNCGNIRWAATCAPARPPADVAPAPPTQSASHPWHTRAHPQSMELKSPKPTRSRTEANPSMVETRPSHCLGPSAGLWRPCVSQRAHALRRTPGVAATPWAVATPWFAATQSTPATLWVAAAQPAMDCGHPASCGDPRGCGHTRQARCQTEPSPGRYASMRIVDRLHGSSTGIVPHPRPGRAAARES